MSLFKNNPSVNDTHRVGGQTYKWNGTTWKIVASGLTGALTSSSRIEFVATAGQTEFTPVTYTPGHVDVYMNGIHLDSSDYTATDGTKITLTTPVVVDTELYVVAYAKFAIDDHYTKSEVDSKDATNASAIAAIPPATITEVSDQTNTSTGYLDIPSGTTAQRPGSPDSGVMRFNTTTTKIEIFSNGVWLDLDTPPLISSVGYPGSATAADPAGSETITIHGSNFSTPTVIKFRDTSTGVTTVFTGAVTLVNSTQLSITSQALPAADYDLLVESNGVTGVFSGGYTTNALPGWTTAAGNLGSVGGGTTVSITVAASETDGGPIAYSVTSGSLPTGLSLTTNVIGGTAGTVAADTTSTFTMRAIDDEGQIADRTFNIVVKSEYILDNSLRFNDDSNAHLSWTPTTAGNRKTWTFSAWVKRGSEGEHGIIAFNGSYVPYLDIMFGGHVANNDQLQIIDWPGGSASIHLVTTQLFRDYSAWYHIVVKCDTTQSISSDRVKLYVNGEQITDFSTEIYPLQNIDTNANNTTTNGHEIGATTERVTYFDGYISEVNFIDGQALNPTAFGKAHDIYGHWVPTIYSGTYGTNGFHLDFKDTYTGSNNTFTNSNAFTALSLNNTITPEVGAVTTYGTLTTNASNGPFGLGYVSGWAQPTTNNSTAGSNGLSTGDDAALNNMASGRTWMAWYKGTQSGTRNDLYRTEMPIFGDYRNSIYANLGVDDGRIAFGAAGLYHGSASDLVNDNVWHHLTWTFGGKNTDTIKMYVDGVFSGESIPLDQQNASVWNNARLDAVSMAYASYPVSSPENLAGIQVLKHALPPEDILSVYQGKKYVLGDDANGSNNWIANNISGADQVVDTPTNNFATMNPLDDAYSETTTGNLAEGNLNIHGNSTGSWFGRAGTLAPSSGKWYFEILVTSSNIYSQVGIHRTDVNSELGAGVFRYRSSGDKVTSSGYSAYGQNWAGAGAIIGIRFDLDSGSIKFYKNNVSQGSISMGTVDGHYTPVMMISGSASMIANFGQDSSFAGNKASQNNADGNGYGDFYYAPPTGFLSLCTRNLPDPAVVPGEHFNAVLYTGNSSTQSITGVGFQPDFLWLKARSDSRSHSLIDVVRGFSGSSAKVIQSESTNAEWNSSVINSLDSDGFSVSGSDNYVNNSSHTYVAWNWKAGGTAVSNTDGTNTTAMVSANVNAGFSIVSYAGNGVDNSTIGHGLDKEPEMVIIKGIDSVENWMVYHKDLTAGSEIILNSTGAQADDVNNATWGDNHPSGISTSTFGVGYAGDSNSNSTTYIAYCFHSVEGYSKVGSYTGNGSNDGTFVYTGFRPAYVLVKWASGNQDWTQFDNQRDPFNYANKYLHPSASQNEGSYDTIGMDMLSNGFKPRTTYNHLNTNNGSYIFIAFAEHPFKYSNAR